MGRVTNSPWSAATSEGGGVSVDPLSLRAVGFLEVDLDVAAAQDGDTLGTLFKNDEWQLLAVSPNLGKIGSLLPRFLKALYTCYLPKSLGGVPLGDKLRAVYDEPTAAWASLGPMEPVQGYALNGVKSTEGGGFIGKSVSLLLGTFQPNDRLIELTPVLVHNADRKAKASTGIPTVYGGTSLAVRLRMAPFRTAVLPSNTLLANPVDMSHFSTLSWDALPRLIATDFTQLDGVTDGADEVTAATASMSLSDAPTLSQSLGLPVMDGGRVLRDGFRLASTTWPFLPARGDNAYGDTVEFTRLLAATLMQYQAPSAFFESGSATLAKYSPAFKPGNVVVFNVRYGSETRKLTAYLTEVTHSVEADGVGTVVGTTTLGFQRGLWDERLRKPSLELPARATPTQSTAPAPAGACSIGAPALSFPAHSYAPDTPPLVDSSGFDRGSGAFQPYSPNGMNWNALEWLRDWAVARVAATESGSSRLSPSGDENARVNVRDAIEGLIGVDSAHKQMTAEHMIAAAAAMYCIERYWKQVYPNARIRITSWTPRPHTGLSVDGHYEGWGFDFYVEPGSGSGLLGNVGALQTWGGLWRLAAAERIPWGGRGVYLNVNPDAGIKGVTQDTAGGSEYGPAGGSSGVHYDTRGYFHRPSHGAVNLSANNNPKKWGAVERIAWIKAMKSRVFPITMTVVELQAQPLAIAAQAAYDLAVKTRNSWIATNFAGDGVDEFQLGGAYTKFGGPNKIPVTQTLNQVLLNIADPSGELDDIHWTVGGVVRFATTTAPYYRAYLESRAAYWATRPAGEASRVGVRELVKAYFGNPLVADPLLPTVGPTVPNMNQVLNNVGCFAGGAAV
jgi:hypothetical protein